MTVPAAAATENVTTSVDIQTGSGGAPVVVAKWEWTDNINQAGIQFVDDDPVTPGLQVLPPLKWQTIKDVYYFALVDDPQGDSNVAHVYADVWHPIGSPYPYNQNNYFKYQLELSRFPIPGVEELLARDAFQAALAANLVTFGLNPATQAPYTTAQVLELIDQQSVGKFFVKGYIDYEQPAGSYRVQIRGVDSQNNVGTLDNSFTYIPVSMVEFDFNSFNYGQVFPDVVQEVDGDRNFASPDAAAGNSPLNGATVRNIGNVWSQITVRNSDLSQPGYGPLGKTSGEWNVRFDARMSDPDLFDNGTVIYSPEQTVTLPRDLYLSSWEKLDFSIKIMKFGINGNWTGTMTLGSVATGFPWVEGAQVNRTGPYNPIVSPS